MAFSWINLTLHQEKQYGTAAVVTEGKTVAEIIDAYDNIKLETVSAAERLAILRYLKHLPLQAPINAVKPFSP